jgi:hypothetical protein
MYAWLLDGVWVGWWHLLHNLRTLQFNAANTSVLNLLKSPLSVSWQRILTLNYILQISRYYSTCKAFSSQPDLQFRWTPLNNSDASVQLLYSQVHILGGWRLETLLTLSCHLFWIISPTAISRDCLSSSGYIALGRPQQKTSFPNHSSIVIEACLPRHCIETVVILLHACSFPREPVYRAVAYQRKSILAPLFGLSGATSQYNSYISCLFLLLYASDFSLTYILDLQLLTSSILPSCSDLYLLTPRRLGGLQSRSRFCGEEKGLCVWRVSNPVHSSHS